MLVLLIRHLKQFFYRYISGHESDSNLSEKSTSASVGSRKNTGAGKQRGGGGKQQQFDPYILVKGTTKTPTGLKVNSTLETLNQNTVEFQFETDDYDPSEIATAFVSKFILIKKRR